jgi:putative holliday junction resolvase
VTARILAIDFGTKRMGLAVSDALGMTAQGLPTIQRTRIADDMEHLRSLVEEYSVERVLVGIPLVIAAAKPACRSL